MGEGTTTVTRDLNTRVELVESRLSGITTTLDGMREEQRNERKEISAAFEALRRDLGTKARPFPAREVSTAVALTLAVLGAAVSVLNWWYDARSALTDARVAALTQTADPGEMAVLRYRLEKVEAATSGATTK